MYWIIDLILVLIIAAAGFIGYKKGIIKMLLSFVLILISLVAAYQLSAPVADVTYDLLLEDKISRSVDKAMEGQTMETADQAVETFLETGSIGFIVGSVNFDSDGAVEAAAGDSIAEISQNLKENVVRPPAVMMLRVICAFILFLVIYFLLNFILRLVTRSKKLPFIRFANQWLGCALGVATGVAICIALCAVMNLALSVPAVNLFGITPQIKEQTFIYDFLSATFLAN